MFDMSLDWWEFVVRGAIVYLVLLGMMRVSGRRTVGQFTPFDLLVVMLLSESVSNALTGGDQSVGGGLIVAAVLVALNMLMAFLSAHSKKMDKMLDGTAVLLGRHGFFYEDVIKKCRLSDAEVEEAMREADCKREEMEYAFLEADGHITVLKKRES
ncbi:DUF421 domain-containing protein [Massilia cavernae]|uniref:DUF421 domain-containing protein n=1 Tax=Massilia cavernae TaxID=2320864 RepID=A0A418XG20_9BURK|nr:YetF domain-containing protein [Massilia cavernae]RJG11414.1 DUF421 domain-containing protein [Massilia cavernae]